MKCTLFRSHFRKDMVICTFRYLIIYRKMERSFSKSAASTRQTSQRAKTSGCQSTYKKKETNIFRKLIRVKRILRWKLMQRCSLESSEWKVIAQSRSGHAVISVQGLIWRSRPLSRTISVETFQLDGLTACPSCFMPRIQPMAKIIAASNKLTMKKS